MPQLTEENLSAIKDCWKVKRFYDSRGLYFELSKAGGRYWRWKYRFGGKEKRLTFGAWPEVSLNEAREKRDSALAVLQSGNDPGYPYKIERLKTMIQDGAERRKTKILNRLRVIDLEMIRLSALEAEKQRLEAELAALDKTLNEVSLCHLQKQDSEQ